jgi:hypothetical protein
MDKPKIGTLIPFGEYNWRVLDVQGDKALIITENVVEQRAYHNKFTDVTWEMCDLRKYLQGEFLERFDEFDKTRIIITYNKNADNVWYKTKGTIDTPDEIFLLSIEEVDYYFGNSGDYLNESRVDNYYISNEYDDERVAKNNEGEAHHWWLRSPGDHKNVAADVYSYGAVRVRGDRVSNDYGVRPALWLNLQGGVHDVGMWFYSSLSMEKIAQKVSNALNSKIYDLDYENKYEWSQQKIGEIDVNISRDHTNVRIRCPVLVIFQSGRTLNRERGFEDEQIKSFGEKLSTEFQTHFYRGNYTYENSDKLHLSEVFEIYN